MHGEVGMVISVSGLRIDAPGEVGGLLILETLIINDFCQCHPPSPTWEDGELSRVNSVARQANLTRGYHRPGGTAPHLLT